MVLANSSHWPKARCLPTTLFSEEIFLLVIDIDPDFMSTPSTGFLSKPVPFSAAKGGVSLDWVYRAWLSKTKVNQFTKKIPCFKNDPKIGGPTKNLPKIRTNILNLQVLSILPCVVTNPFAWSVSLGWWRSLTWPRSASVLVPLSIFYFPWHLGVTPPRWSHDPTNLLVGSSRTHPITVGKKGGFATLKNGWRQVVTIFATDQFSLFPTEMERLKGFRRKKTNSSKRLNVFSNCCSGGVRYWLNSTLIDSCFNRDCPTNFKMEMEIHTFSLVQY